MAESRCDGCRGEGVNVHGEPCCVCQGQWWSILSRDLQRRVTELEDGLRKLRPFTEGCEPGRVLIDSLLPRG